VQNCLVASTVLCTGQFNEVRVFSFSVFLRVISFFFLASSSGCYFSLEALAACFSQRVYHLVWPVVKNKNEREKKNSTKQTVLSLIRKTTTARLFFFSSSS